MKKRNQILTPLQVRAIRAEYKVVREGGILKAVNVIELARKFNISQLLVRDIANGRKYKNVA